MFSKKVVTPYTQWKQTLVIGIGVYIAMYIAWGFWGRETPDERFLVGSISLLFTSLMAFSIAIWVINQLDTGKMRTAWIWMCAGLLLWTLADAAHLAPLSTWFHSNAATTLRDLLLVLGFIPIWIGLMHYPRPPLLNQNRTQLWINITVTTTAIVTLIWIVIITPLQQIPYQPGDSLIAIYVPIADLISLILLMIYFLLSDTRKIYLPLMLVSLGIFSYLFSDLIYAQLLPQTGYEMGGLLNTGWVIGDAFFILGAFEQLRDHKYNTPPLFSTIFTRLQTLLPFLSIIALGWYAIIDWWVVGKFNPLGLWVTFLLSLAMIVRQAMMAGEASIRQYASLVNSIAEATFVCDQKGNLQLINPAFVALTAVQLSNTLSDININNLLDSPKPWQSILIEAQKEGWSGETLIKHPDGKEIPVSLSLRPIHPKEDHRLVIAGTLFDLSEQKKQQAALTDANEQINQDRAQLEYLNSQLEQIVIERTRDLRLAYQQVEEQNITLQKLDQIKSDFVSMVSHELRAPLTNINGGIELLLSKPGQPPDSQQKLLLVQKEIVRLTHFVETILDLSALDAGKLPLYPMPMDFNAFILQFKETFQHQQDIARVRWLLLEESAVLYADDHALHSILFHLLDNAIKYAPQGEIVVRAEIQAGAICIHIEDEGPGIGQDIIPLLFDRFYRPDSQDAQTVYGYGLGLYIVKRLTETMQGHVTVQNRLPVGAVFSVCLPRFQEGMDE
jgi:PAS domain S-box-containing protein